jgi:hypothetical protein
MITGLTRTDYGHAAFASVLLIGDHADPSPTFGWVLTGDWAGHGLQIASGAASWIALPQPIGTVRHDIS